MRKCTFCKEMAEAVKCITNVDVTELAPRPFKYMGISLML